MNIDVAVIPAAGRGTRMRPFTRTVPKPLLPVLEKPVIQYVVEEAVDAGISEIIFIVGSETAVLDHFTTGDPIEGLEHVRFSTVEQLTPDGLGDAIRYARGPVDGRHFAVLLSDMFPAPGKSYLGDMTAIDSPNVVAVQEVNEHFLDRWGIVDPAGDGNVFSVAGAIEKPGKERAPSNLGLVGRYLFSADVFDVLDALEPGWGGEIQLTDAINVLSERGEVSGMVVQEPLLDAGIPLGLAKATVEVALRRPDLRDLFTAFLTDLDLKQD